MAKDYPHETSKTLMQVVMGKEIGAGKFRVFQARSIDQKETFAVKLFPTTQSARSISSQWRETNYFKIVVFRDSLILFNLKLNSNLLELR